MFKFLKYLIQASFVYFFFFIGRILGIKISRIFFSKLFSFLGPIFRSEKIINKNLEFFSSQNSNFDKKKIISQMWENYGMTFIEYVFLEKFRENNSRNLQNQELLEETMRNNKPLIFVSGHFANFELMSMEITKKYQVSYYL